MTIQWIAAAMAQKELIYYCSGDTSLAEDLGSIAQLYSLKSASKRFFLHSIYLI